MGRIQYTVPTDCALSVKYGWDSVHCPNRLCFVSKIQPEFCSENSAPLKCNSPQWTQFVIVVFFPPFQRVLHNWHFKSCRCAILLVEKCRDKIMLYFGRNKKPL